MIRSSIYTSLLIHLGIAFVRAIGDSFSPDDTLVNASFQSPWFLPSSLIRSFIIIYEYMQVIMDSPLSQRTITALPPVLLSRFGHHQGNKAPYLILPGHFLTTPKVNKIPVFYFSSLVLLSWYEFAYKIFYYASWEYGQDCISALHCSSTSFITTVIFIIFPFFCK